jgi:hypothetical protein
MAEFPFRKCEEGIKSAVSLGFFPDTSLKLWYHYHNSEHYPQACHLLKMIFRGPHSDSFFR